MRKLNHSNSNLHNWLVYKNGDKQKILHANKIKGVVYDLGCGEASYKEFFLKYANEYIGVDWADSIHTTSADIIADLNKPLSIEDEIADTVISFSVMEHLYEPQIMLNEAFRILKKDSYLILQVPWQWQIHEAPYDFYRYTEHGLKYMLQKAGFVNIKIEPQSGFFTMWILKFNYFSRRLIKGPIIVKYSLFFLFIPLWTLGQLLAPFLDKLDKNWSKESTGYFVTARKPCGN